jgi:hypothetical protein
MKVNRTLVLRSFAVIFAIVVLAFSINAQIRQLSDQKEVQVWSLSSSLILEAQTQTSPAPSPAEAEKIIGSRAKEVILALKRRDVRKLSSFVHVKRGLRFSPYPYVTMTGENRDLEFTKKQVKSLLATNKRYAWGAYDGSGKPIRLTAAAYFKRFVYDQDFANAKQISFNGPILGQGNVTNNIHEAYLPGAIVVEYHFSGFDPKREGMDWRSLWLVFENRDHKWYLVGIVHGDWTI